MAQDSDVMQRPAGEALQPADGEPTRFTVSVRVNGDMVRGAISYRFNWTPLGLIFGTDRI